MNHGAAEQEMLAETMSTPKEKSLRKKKRLVLCVLFLFWGKGCSLKTSLGFGGEAAAGS